MSDKTTFDLKTSMRLGDCEQEQQPKEMNKKTTFSC